MLASINAHSSTHPPLWSCCRQWFLAIDCRLVHMQPRTLVGMSVNLHGFLKLSKTCSWKPLFLWKYKPGDETKYGNGSEDHWRIYKISERMMNASLVHSQLKVLAVTGKRIGENSTAARYMFHTNAMKFMGLDHLPRDHLAVLKPCGVMKHRPTRIISISPTRNSSKTHSKSKHRL